MEGQLLALYKSKTELTSRSITIPLAIMVAGPGVLAAMWWTMDWPEGINGFPAFRSGSIGDALLLPAMVGSLLWLIDRCQPVTTERRWMVVTGIVGAATGALVQWLWWSDPKPPTQWGLAGPRDFTIAGWWHAVFFVSLSTALAVWGTQMLVRVRSELEHGNTAQLTTPAFALLVTSLLTFCGLLAMDSSPTAASQSSTSSLWALAMALAVLLALGAFMWGRRASVVLRPVLAGVVGAVTAVLSCISWPPSRWQVVLFVLAVLTPMLTSTQIRAGFTKITFRRTAR